MASKKQKLVKVPANLFRLLYTTADTNPTFRRVEITTKDKKKSYNGIATADGIESFLIVSKTH